MRNRVLEEKKKVIVVSLVTALCLLGDSMLYVVLPVYWYYVGLLSLWEVGLILSINRLVRLPLNPFIGWLYTKITLRTGLIIAVLLATITTIGYGFADGLWLWLLLRCVWGFTWSLLRLGGFFTVISYANDQNRGYLMGLYNGLYRLGSLFGMLIGGILSSIIGLKYVCILFGLFSLLGLPLILMTVDHTLVTEKTNKSAIELKQLPWLHPHIVKVIFSGFIIALLIQGVFTSTLSFMIGYHFSDTISLFGFMIGVAALSGILQAARWAWEPFLAAKIGSLSDGPKGRVPYFIASLIISAIGYACISWSMPIYIWFILVLIIMLSATALTTLMDALTADVAKTTNAISLMTAYSIALDFGAALGPFLAYLFLNLDNGVMYTYMGGAILFFIVAMIWYIPQKKLENNWSKHSLQQ